MSKTPLFFNTSKQEGHTHVLYMSPDQTGITSRDGNHYHVGSVQTDEDGGIVLDKGGKPVILLGMAVDVEGNELDQHTHEVRGVVKVIKESPETSKVKAETVISHWEANRAYNERFRKKARSSEDMVVPDKQWEEGVKQTLNSERKAALSVPFITTNVMTLVGVYMSQATDLSVDPVEASDNEIIGPVNALFKHVLARNKTIFHERKAFEDQVITGIGTLQARIDHIDNPSGDIKIERIPWTDVDYGPHQLEDQSDMTSLTISKFIAVNQLKAMYPDKAQDFNLMASEYKRDMSESSSTILQEPVITEKASNNTNIFKVDGDVEKVMVVELHKIKRVKTPVLTDPEGVRHNLSLYSDNIVNKIATIPVMRVQKVIQKAIHITTAAGSVLLSESVSKHSEFTVVASYGIKRDQDIVSFVDMQADQQKAINRHTSQLEHYGNTMLGSHFQIAEDALTNLEEAERILASNGGIITYNADKAPDGVQRIDPPQPPAALFSMIEQNQQKMFQIANLQGFQQEEGGATGVLGSLQKRQALLGHEYLFANMRLAMERLGRVILEMMDEVYFKNPQRAARILLNSSVVNVDSTFDPTAYTEEQLIELLQRVDITEFDLVVSESPHSKTQREIDLMLTLEFLQRGVIDPGTASALLMNLSGLSSFTKLQADIENSDKETKESKASTDDKQLVASFGDDATKLELMQQYNMIPENEPEQVGEGGAEEEVIQQV